MGSELRISAPCVLGVGENGVFVQMTDMGAERLETEEHSNLFQHLSLKWVNRSCHFFVRPDSMNCPFT